MQVGDFFTVAGSGDDEVRVEGDLRRVKYVGSGMSGGRLTVAGDVGMHAGAGMTGGELVIEGDAGDWAGAAMRGGRLVVRGSAGRQLAANSARSPFSDSANAPSRSSYGTSKMFRRATMSDTWPSFGFCRNAMKSSRLRSTTRRDPE